MIRRGPVAAAAISMVLVVGACTAEDTPPSPAAPAAAVQDVSPTTTLELAAVPEDGYAVGQRSVELVDQTRPTRPDPTRGLAASANRTLPVVIVYPAEGDPGGPIEIDAPVAEGRFPLVLFSHGWTASGPAYVPRIEHWARRGYVVAAPTFPLSSGPGGQLSDYSNQPDDVSFVIDEVLERAATPGDPFHDHIDPDRVAAAGHSLGAATTVGLTYHSCCVDKRIDAAVEISGIELPFPRGDYSRRPPTPLLLIHGGGDRLLRIGYSEQIFATTTGPAYFARFPAAGHTDIIGDANGELVDDLVLAFFARYLRDDFEAIGDLDDTLAESDRATLEVRGLATGSVAI
jgi:dienelactone hydrolase